MKAYIETYGCQMNEYDSGIVQTLLLKAGFSIVRELKNAGVILINTCAVRENAHSKIFVRLSSLSSLKEKKQAPIIGIIGCMAQNLGLDFLAMGLPVDLIAGPDNYRRIPEMIKEIVENKKSNLCSLKFDKEEMYEEINPNVIKNKKAYVTIMRGCNNFCSFCVVPYTRGRERSKSASAVLSEIKELINLHGTKEVMLLGQNVNSYNSGDERNRVDFTDLVQMILDETTISRIRFTSPHPHDFPKKLLKLMAENERFCSHIHLPLQSGSTNILKKMGRNYSNEDFIELVSSIRETIGPDVSITTDVMVGFPGETESQFQETLAVMKKVEFDMAYMFKYSERKGTIASRKYHDDISEETKLLRLRGLIDMQMGIGLKKNLGELSKIHLVLVEGPSRRSEDEFMGRTLNNKMVVFPIPVDLSNQKKSLFGKEIRVEIVSATAATLLGRAV